MLIFTKQNGLILLLAAFAPVLVVRAQNSSGATLDSGNSSGDTMTGTGTVTIGSTSGYSGGTTISGGTLIVNSGGTGTGTIAVGTGTLTLGGTISTGTSTLGTGTSTLSTGTTTNSSGGTIVDGGTLTLNGSGTGTLTLGTGTTTISTGTLTTGSGIVGLGAGTITVTGGGSTLIQSGDITILPGYSLNINSSVSFSTINHVPLTNGGTLAILAGANLGITMGYLQNATGILTINLAGVSAMSNARVSVTGDTSLAGQLQVRLTQDFIPQMAMTDTFTLLATTGSLTGTFGNVPDGGRITTTDGLGSFQVNYTGNAVLLSNFVAAHTTVNVTGDNVEVTFPSVRGRAYHVQVSSDMRNWTTAVDNITGDGTSMTITVPNGWQTQAAFFRVGTDVPGSP